MQLINGYWTDDNGNKWDKRIYAEDIATQLSKALKGCKNCTDCTDCESCFNCFNCMGCTCCVSCTDCKSCINCKSCIICNSCTNCVDCKVCANCSNCMGCINCKVLWGANSYKNQPSAYMTRRMGRRNDITYIYCGDTDNGKSVQVVCGCFRGDLDEFEAAVQNTHGGNEHGQAYMREIAKVRQLLGLEGNDEQGTRNV